MNRENGAPYVRGESSAFSSAFARAPQATQSPASPGVLLTPARALLAAAVLLNLALAFARPPDSQLWVHPVAPPLTHILEMGEPLLGEPATPPSRGPPPRGSGPTGPPPLRGFPGLLDSVVRSIGTPEQKAATAALRGVDGSGPAQRAMALRLAVQSDAIAVAKALGPERVGVILARKDTLSTRIGEGRAWTAAFDRLGP